MSRLWNRVLAAALLLLATQASAFADKRVALIIGNGAYAHAPHLSNPTHDAEDVAAALKRSGFDTIVGLDLDQGKMQDAAIRFARAARTADVAVFYYSGHALQFSGVNYLMPIDAQLADEADLHRLMRVDDISADLQQARNLRVLILDSCRDNPLAENLKRAIGSTRGASVTRGLAKMESPEGTIVAYSTQAGRTAEDGSGRNSPYTAAFLRHVEEREEIGTIFRRVSADVYESTRRAQLPELSLSLIGDYYLNGRPQNPADVATPDVATATTGPSSTLSLTDKYQIGQPGPPGSEPAVPSSGPTSDGCAAAESHWKGAEELGTIGAFEDHIARFPNCAFVGLARGRIEQLRTAGRVKSSVAKSVAAIEPSTAYKALGVAWNHRGAWAVRAAADLETANLAAMSACNRLYGSCFLGTGVNSSSFACLSIARNARHGKNLTSATRSTLEDARDGALELCSRSYRGRCIVEYAACNGQD